MDSSHFQILHILLLREYFPNDRRGSRTSDFLSCEKKICWDKLRQRRRNVLEARSLQWFKICWEKAPRFR